MSWEIKKINKNLYNFVLDDKYIDVRVNHIFIKDVEINILNMDMSKDNVIFIKNVYPTEPTDNFVVIGEAYLYEDKICIGKSLIDVE